MKAHLAASVVVGILAAIGRGESSWPQWRGPAGDGTTAAVAPVTEWGPEKNVRWRRELIEAGNSTPVVWGERVFLTQSFSETQQRGLLCLDRQTGEELWRRGVVYTADDPTHRTNPYCSPSAAVDDGRVIAWFGSAGLICWDHEGAELWRRDLGVQKHQWGYGSSPVLYDGLCILNFGPGDREFLLAVHIDTGETVWKNDAWDDKRERSVSGPGNDGGASDYERSDQRSERLRGSWSTPLVTVVEDKPQLIVTLPRRLAAYDPFTGKLLWYCGGGAPLAYASPAEQSGVVVALGGYRGASFAVRSGGTGDITDAARVWHKPSDSGWLGSGVIDDGALYVANMRGVLSCIDTGSGDVLWSERTEGGGTWSSVTRDGARNLFLLSKSGVTTVFRPNREGFEVVAVNDLDEKTNASVVVTDRELLIRTDEALWSIGASTSTQD